MPRFKNVSGLTQLIRFPSVHLQVNDAGGVFWDEDQPRKTLEPGEIIEVSDARDIDLLRILTTERKVKVRGETKKQPPVFAEIG